MIWLVYSAKSSRKIVHKSHCKVIQRISKENRRSIGSIEKAQELGYRFCLCCSSMAKRYRKEKNEAESFCNENQMNIRIKDEVIHVISRHDCWRIIENGNNKKIFLYHKNTESRRYKEKYQNLVPGFHWQKFKAENIMEYLKYIKEHDDYRDVKPFDDHKPGKYLSKDTTSTAQWIADKYGHPLQPKWSYKKVKGTKKHRKEQRMKQRKERKADIIRVLALIDELAVMNN